MGKPVVAWDGHARYCADHALTEGPPEWSHKVVEVTVLPGCPPDVAAEVQERARHLRARAEGIDPFDWRAELIVAIESWAARDEARPDSFSTTAWLEGSFDDEPDASVSTRRVRMALAAAIAERRRLDAEAE